MEANKRKITDIFNGSRLLKVPFFQRSYVWGKEQWQRLLSDMEFITSEYGNDEHGYFLGSIIFKQEMGPVESHIADSRTIVDGQQRLTTLAIFLKVLYLLNDKDRQFKRKFCLDDDDETVAIRHSHNDISDFEQIMKLETIQTLDGTSGIIQAYNYFKKTIVIEKLSIDAILKNVLFVVIDLNSNEDEQLIFDTINSLGVRLTTGELLKNYFFKEGAISKYERYWKPVFDDGETCISYWSNKMTTGRIKKDFIETFFYAYLQVRIQDRTLDLSTEAKKVYRRTEGLFNNYKTIIRDKSLDTDLLIQEITNYGKLFKKSFTLDIDKEQIPSTFSIERICFIIFVLDVATLFPYIMYILKNVPEKEERNKIFGYIESYIIRRFLCDAKNNNYSDLFSENLIGQEIKSYEGLKAYIEDKNEENSLAMPSDDKVKQGVLSTEFNNKRALAILYLLESRLRESTMHTLVLRPFSEYTLEHIMPKKWEGTWPISPNYSTEDRESLIKTIGNMTLLSAKLNSSISNAKWQTKKNGKNSMPGLATFAVGVVTLKDALTLEKWDEDTIKQRALALFDDIKKVWPK